MTHSADTFGTFLDKRVVYRFLALNYPLRACAPQTEKTIVRTVHLSIKLQTHFPWIIREIASVFLFCVYWFVVSAWHSTMLPAAFQENAREQLPDCYICRNLFDSSFTRQIISRGWFIFLYSEVKGLFVWEGRLRLLGMSWQCVVLCARSYLFWMFHCLSSKN